MQLSLTEQAGRMNSLVARSASIAASGGEQRTVVCRHVGRTAPWPERLRVTAIAAGFGLGGAESYPGVFGAFGGFADDAKVEDGFVSLSDRPGIGFERQAALYALMRRLVE